MVQIKTKKTRAGIKKTRSQLFGKYLRGSSTQADYIPEEMRRELHECLEQAGEDRALLGPELFLEVREERGKLEGGREARNNFAKIDCIPTGSLSVPWPGNICCSLSGFRR